MKFKALLREGSRSYCEKPLLNTIKIPSFDIKENLYYSIHNRFLFGYKQYRLEGYYANTIRSKQ